MHKWWNLLEIKIEALHMKPYLKTDFSWQVAKIFKLEMKCYLAIILRLK